MSIFVLLFPVSLLLHWSVSSLNPEVWFVLDDMSSWSLSLQAGDGGRGVLLRERAGSALSGASGLKHAGDLGAEKVMTDSSSRPIRPLRHACHHGDQLRGQWMNRLGTRGLACFNTSVTLEWSSSALHLWLRDSCANRTDFLRRPNQDKLECSWELWGIGCFVVGDASSVPPSVPSLQCNSPFMCNSVWLLLLLLLNYLITEESRNGYLFELILMLIDQSCFFFSHKAFRW